MMTLWTLRIRDDHLFLHIIVHTVAIIRLLNILTDNENHCISCCRLSATEQTIAHV